ncbi:MAG: agmatinase [Elusimicrobiales bacterium]
MKRFLEPPRLCGREASLFAVVPVPYERSTSYGRGAARGPAAVLDASSQLEFWDEELACQTWERGIYTAPPVNCKGPVETVFRRMEAVARGYAGGGPVPFFIGGEHSITQALYRPFLEKYPGLSILHFDAHADLRDRYEGSPRSHASALYPASLECRVVQFGIRSVAPEEACRVNAGNVKTFFAHQRIPAARLAEKILAALGKNVYITLDVDGFDPSVIPATGTPQPGGLLWHETLDILRAVCRRRKVVAVDVVEVSPVKGQSISEFAAAKLIYRLMGYLSPR